MFDRANRGGFAVLRSRGGAAAAEFALVLPILLLLLMGIMQMGAMMYSYNLMVSTARDTARAMAVCTITDNTSATTQAKKSLPPWVAATSWTITPSITATDVSMTISVPVAEAAIIGYIPMGVGQMTSFVTMKKEPLAFGGGAC